MAPSQTLKWIESGKLPSQQNVELEGTEPYIVGGHTASGYWVDTGRRTTLKGLYAAGDVAGGAPKKFVTGALVEGQIAAQTALSDLAHLAPVSPAAAASQAQAILDTYETHLGAAQGRYTVEQLEEAMQKVMDNYAGGIHTGYRYNQQQLDLAAEKIDLLTTLSASLSAKDMDELLQVYELKERLVVCKSVIAHLGARKETRWPGFSIHTDYPQPSADWNKYVNSRMVAGEIQVFCRELVKGVEHYEHPDFPG
jgi:adenylylsulfate reductase subunit A